MQKISKILFFSIVILFPVIAHSQEIVTGLQGNIVAQKYYSGNQFSKKASIPSDTIELPFIDDFSDSDVEPKRSLWSDKYAYINSNYPIYPPTVGVATLDALNFDGSQYPNANTTHYQADYLTSHSINLAYPVSDNIFLSFFYEPGGLAETPETSDSLILDFLSPDSLKWNKIWSTPGIVKRDSLNCSTFKRVMIKIDNPEYLKKGFKFRFRNYASQLPNNDDADKRANVDLWHIDYVKLERNKSISDTILRDVSFMDPIKSILKEYTSIPWTHFGSAKNTQIAPYIEVTIKNHDSTSRNTGTVLEIKDLLNTRPVYKIPALKNDIASGDSILYKFSYTYPYDFTTPGFGAFEIKTILQTDAFDYKPNDTLKHVQKFYDYYSLDDGTAEASYGIHGDGTKDASSAIKFNSFEGDSLRSVDIYFAQLIDSLNLDYYFYLNVWQDNAGKPGGLLVNQVGMRPEYSDELNKFVRYKLDSPVFIKGVFYIGFTNTVERLLNVGLDMNKLNKSKVFYNSNNGLWTNSTLPGTPMMRPVFQKNLSLSVKPDEIFKINVWPNPADDFITISVDESGNDWKIIKAELFDIDGRIIRTFDLSNNKTISTSQINSGMYFLHITETGPTKSITRKIIIKH